MWAWSAETRLAGLICLTRYLNSLPAVVPACSLLVSLVLERALSIHCMSWSFPESNACPTWTWKPLRRLAKQSQGWVRNTSAGARCLLWLPSVFPPGPVGSLLSSEPSWPLLDGWHKPLVGLGWPINSFPPPTREVVTTLPAAALI